MFHNYHKSAELSASKWVVVFQGAVTTRDVGRVQANSERTKFLLGYIIPDARLGVRQL